MKNLKARKTVNKAVSAITLLCFCGFHPLAMGSALAEDSPLPYGPTVQDGSVTFNSPNDVTLNINQMSQEAIIDWIQFCIARGYTVNFNMPGSESVSLNRVTGGDISRIFGALNANGHVWLINPNGIIFGPTSRIDASGFLASSLDISNQNFLNHAYIFTKGPGANGYVINEGRIVVKDGGYVAMLGGAVQNGGLIQAKLGKVSLASGAKMALELDGDGVISVVVDGPVTEKVKDDNGNEVKDAVANKGTIAADGGVIILTADVLKDVFENAVNTTGLIQADSIENVNGQIYLRANDRVNVGGVINAEGGTVNVDSQGANYYGTINSKEGLFNANDGDTNLSGTYTGNKTFMDNGNITVNGDLIINTNVAGHANLTIRSDNNNSGGGDFIQKAGTTIRNSGSGNDITIRSGRTANRGTGNVTLGTVISVNNLDISAHGGSISRNSDTTGVSGNALTLTAANGIGTNLIPLLTTISAVTASNSTTGNIVISNIGDLSVAGAGVVNSALTGNVNLEATGGIDLDNDISANGNVILDANGLITDNGSGAVISADGLGLISHTDGISLEDIEVNTLAVHAAGDVEISSFAPVDLTIGTVGGIDGITAANLALTETNGNIKVDKNINVASGAVSLIANKGITNVTGDEIVTADVLTVDAATGITLNTAINSIDASTSGAGDITINQTGAIDLTDVDTANGAIIVNAGGQIAATDVASLTDNNANDITLTGVGIQAGSIDAGTTGDVKLDALTGAITQDGDAAPDVKADELEMLSSAGIDVDTQAANLAAANSTSGSVTIDNTGDLILNDITSSGGALNISASENITQFTGTTVNSSGGDISIVGGQDILLGLLDAGDGGITVSTSGGSILDNNGDDINLKAGDYSYLRAASTTAGNGIIGTDLNPIEVDVQVTPANLLTPPTVNGGGATSGLILEMGGVDLTTGISGNIRGIVRPGSGYNGVIGSPEIIQTTVLPQGLVYYEDTDMGGTLSVIGGAGYNAAANLGTRQQIWPLFGGSNDFGNVFALMGGSLRFNIPNSKNTVDTFQISQTQGPATFVAPQVVFYHPLVEVDMYEMPALGTGAYQFIDNNISFTNPALAPVQLQPTDEKAAK